MLYIKYTKKSNLLQLFIWLLSNNHKLGMNRCDFGTTTWLWLIYTQTNTHNDSVTSSPAWEMDTQAETAV